MNEDLRLEGIIPATVLPMTSTYQIDEDSLEKYIKWLIRYRVGGLAVNVDTGEGPQLYEEEKIRVLHIVKRIVGDKVPIIAGLQGSSTLQAVESARRMKDAGADILLVFPAPAFHGSPLPAEIPYRYHKAITSEADIPIIIFQLQRDLGGVEYTPECLIKLAEIRGVKAIKEASFDAYKFLNTLRLMKKTKDISVLTGNDNFIYESLILGADGALIGFGTLATDLQIEMFNLVKEERIKEAREIANRLQPLADVIFAPPVRNYRARIKEALVMLGILENAHVRPPLTPITGEERESIRRALKEADLL